MSQEHGLFLTYPSAPSPVDLEIIRGYMRERRSAAESVARLITVDDVALLIKTADRLLEDLKLMSPILIRAYSHPALAFLTAAYGKALGIAPPHFGNTDEPTSQAIDEIFMGFLIVPEESHNLLAWDRLETTNQAQQLTFAAELQSILESEGVLEVVDRYSQRFQDIINTKLPSFHRETLTEAVQKGRDRFHLLLEAVNN